MAILLSGCSSLTPNSYYAVHVPTLTAPVQRVHCELNGRPEECAVLLYRDWRAVIKELVGACIANGQKECEQ